MPAILLVVSLLLSTPSAPVVLSAAKLQADVERAYAEGKHEYTVPPGAYELPRAAADFFLNFSGMENFAIRAPGVTFTLEDATKGGFHFSNCKNVTLSGLTMLHDPVPFSQATITGVDPQDQWIDVEVMAGYPDWVHNSNVLPENSVGYIFDRKSRQWKAGTIDAFFSRVTPLGGRKFRVNIDNPDTQPISVGDFFVCRGNIASDIQLDQCAKMDIQNVTIKSSTGFCVHEADGDGGNHYTFKLVYGPPPTGGAVRPLISSNADAFHSNATRQGPIVEHCLFEGMPDDGTNIHGNYADVVETKGNVLIVNTLWGDLPVRPGDPLLYYSSTDVPLNLSSVIKSARPLPNYVPARSSSLPQFQGLSNFWEIQLDKPLKLQQDDLVAMPMAEGNGFVYRNNTIRNNRARGILIKASDGIVENNSIDGSTIAGIVISPEPMESDFVHNLVVRGNIIRHVAYQNIGSWINQAGAISVTSDPGGGIGHQGILIEDNIIEFQDGINLLVTNARDVTIRNNSFVNPERQATDRGSTYGFEPNAVIDLEDDRGIVLDGNNFVSPGPAMKSRLHVGKNVQGVTHGLSSKP